MDFNALKKKSQFPKATARNPWMGLNGEVCKAPAYWCRWHEVWLSESDVALKKCLAKPTYDMLSTRKCNCIERKGDNPFIKRR